MYLPDTNACIKFINGSSIQLIDTWRQHAASTLFISTIVTAELRFGVANSDKVNAEENGALLDLFLVPYTEARFDSLCAMKYGYLRAELKRKGKPIGAMDMLIAATALAYDFTIITHNTREFSQVEGLKLEDWE